jgi:hypothetical protein
MTSLTLLTNASATGNEATWPGGPGVFMVSGAITRGRVKLQFKAPDNATWVDAGERSNMAHTGAGTFALPAGVKIRAALDELAVAGVLPSAVTAVVGQLNEAAAGAAAGPDRELAVVTYLVKTAFAGAAVGDTVTMTQVLDLSGAQPTTVATVWRNQSAAADLAGAPSAANLTIAGAGGLTAAQLPVSLGPKASADSVSMAPASDALFPVNTLAMPGAAQTSAVSSTVVALTLATTTRRISIFARNADLRYVLWTGATAPAAAAVVHFLGMNERLDFTVPANGKITFIRAGTTDGIAEVTELA